MMPQNLHRGVEITAKFARKKRPADFRKVRVFSRHAIGCGVAEIGKMASEALYFDLARLLAAGNR
jgi:hypothetical protein